MPAYRMFTIMSDVDVTLTPRVVTAALLPEGAVPDIAGLTVAIDAESERATAAEALKANTSELSNYASASASPAAGQALAVYGASYDVAPGIRCTAGNEWFNRLKARLGLTAVGVYGQSGRWSVQAANCALAATTGYFPAFPAGSDWFATPRRGLAVVNTYTNDVANMLAATAPTVTAMTTADANAKALAVGTLLATLSSSAKTEVEATTALTTKAAGWALLGGAGSGGTAHNAIYSTTAGDWVQFTVPGNAQGFVWIVLWATDPTTGIAAPVEIDVNGTSTVTRTTAQLTIRKFTDSALCWWVPTAVKVPIPTTGTVTIRINHTGTAGQYVVTDVILTPAAVPVPVFVVADPTPTSSSSAPIWNPTQVGTWIANRPIYDAAVAPVLAAFPNVVQVPTSLAAPADLSYVDGLHPNDRGMVKRSDEIEAAIRAYLATSDPDSLYATL